MIDLATTLTLSKEEKIAQIQIRQQELFNALSVTRVLVLRDEISQIQKSM